MNNYNVHSCHITQLKMAQRCLWHLFFTLFCIKNHYFNRKYLCSWDYCVNLHAKYYSLDIL